MTTSKITLVIVIIAIVFSSLFVGLFTGKNTNDAETSQATETSQPTEQWCSSNWQDSDTYTLTVELKGNTETRTYVFTDDCGVSRRSVEMTTAVK